MVCISICLSVCIHIGGHKELKIKRHAKASGVFVDLDIAYIYIKIL